MSTIWVNKFFHDIAWTAQLTGDNYPDIDIDTDNTVTARTLTVVEDANASVEYLVAAARQAYPRLRIWQQLQIMSVSGILQYLDSGTWTDFTMGTHDEVAFNEVTFTTALLQAQGRVSVALDGTSITGEKVGIFRAVLSINGTGGGTLTIQMPITFIEFRGYVPIDAAGNYVSDAAGTIVSVPV